MSLFLPQIQVIGRINAVGICKEEEEEAKNNNDGEWTHMHVICLLTTTNFVDVPFNYIKSSNCDEQAISDTDNQDDLSFIRNPSASRVRVHPFTVTTRSCKERLRVTIHSGQAYIFPFRYQKIRFRAAFAFFQFLGQYPPDFEPGRPSMRCL